MLFIFQLLILEAFFLTENMLCFFFNVSVAAVTSKTYFNFRLNILKMLCFPVLIVSKVKFP